jgi:hypothetical protein
LIGVERRRSNRQGASEVGMSAKPDHVRDLKPDIVSAFISAKKIGLWVPGERAFQLSDASFLCEYLRLMGRLLEDGHFDEAKREALAWKPYLNKAKND